MSDLVCRRVVLLVGGEPTHGATDLVPAVNVREASRHRSSPPCTHSDTGAETPLRCYGTPCQAQSRRPRRHMHHASPIALRGVHALALKADLPTHHATGPPRAGPAQSAPPRGSAPAHHTRPSVHPPWRRCGAVPRVVGGGRAWRSTSTM